MIGFGPCAAGAAKTIALMLSRINSKTTTRIGRFIGLFTSDENWACFPQAFSVA
jgi:hypothetical protein